MAGNSEQDKAIVTVGKINELTYDDIILLIDHKTKEGDKAFKLVKNCKRESDFPEGNRCLALDRHVAN